MKRVILALSIIFAMLMLFSCGQAPLGQMVKPTKIGNCVGDNLWEMYEYEDKLFFGTGDGNQNTGPTTVWAYDLSTKEFFESGVLDEEVVNRFLTIDGKLVAPGIDPTQKQNICNYNYYENGQWHKDRNITQTQHCLDIIKYKDHMLYGVDAEVSYHPVFMSTDGGETYERLWFYKDGKRVTKNLSTARVYDFFELNGSLYAILTTNDSTKRYVESYIYDYEGKKFDFLSDLSDQLSIRPYINFKLFGSKLIVNDTVYIATPEGYYTTDMKAFHKIDTGKRVLFDYTTDGEKIYALCSRVYSDGSCETSVMAKDINSNSGFENLFYFKSEYYCVSFVKKGSTFYFGTSDVMSSGAERGAILTVEWTEK